MKLRIGTRGSKLALWQASFVKSALVSSVPSLEISIVKIKTTGDKNLKDDLSDIGGKGVFVKEIEEALFNNKIDLAVHSLKDLPSHLPEGLCLPSVLKRHNPLDAFVSSSEKKIDELSEGSVVATGSDRRKFQILRLYPHLEVVPIRGNVDTRLKKIKTENLDGIILAAAGLERLGLGSLIKQVFDPDEIVPSPCQGIIGLECRTLDSKVVNLLESVMDPTTYICATIERDFLKEFGGDCTVPLGCYSKVDDGEISIKSVFIDKLSGKTFSNNTISEIGKYRMLGSEIALGLKKEIEKGK